MPLPVQSHCCIFCPEGDWQSRTRCELFRHVNDAHSIWHGPGSLQTFGPFSDIAFVRCSDCNYILPCAAAVAPHWRFCKNHIAAREARDLRRKPWTAPPKIAPLRQNSKSNRAPTATSSQSGRLSLRVSHRNNSSPVDSGRNNNQPAEVEGGKSNDSIRSINSSSSSDTSSVSDSSVVRRRRSGRNISTSPRSITNGNQFSAPCLSSVVVAQSSVGVPSSSSSSSSSSSLLLLPAGTSTHQPQTVANSQNQQLVISGTSKFSSSKGFFSPCCETKSLSSYCQS